MSPFWSDWKVTATEENGDVRLVAEGRQNLVRHLRGGGDVGPANVRKMRFGAGSRIGGIDGGRDERGRKAEACNETA